MSILTVDDFLTKKGDDFHIVFDDGPSLDITLVDIATMTIRDFPGKVREPFSLFFEGTRGVLCPQGNYRIRHASGWEVALFIVPIGDKPDGSYRYQAVFN